MRRLPMLSTVEFVLDWQDETKATPQLGSVFHGLIMESISPEYAGRLHEQTLRPFSQNIRFDKSRNLTVWTIHTLTEEASEEIHGVFYPQNRIYELRRRQKRFKIIDRIEVRQQSYKAFADSHILEGYPKKQLHIQLITPTTFKSGGGYIMFPTSKQIMESLINRWNAFSPVFSIGDAGEIDQFLDSVRISKYHLRSTSFSLEGIIIPAFWGDLTLEVEGPEIRRRIIQLLIDFGQYSGIGIKTALGMGGYQIE